MSSENSIKVRVELTALAMVRQVQYIEVPATLTEEEIKALAKETVGNYTWEYEGVQDETVEVASVERTTYG